MDSICLSNSHSPTPNLFWIDDIRREVFIGFGGSGCPKELMASWVFVDIPMTMTTDANIPWVLMCARHGASRFWVWPHLLRGILGLETFQKRNWSCIGGQGHEATGWPKGPHFSPLAIWLQVLDLVECWTFLVWVQISLAGRFGSHSGPQPQG